jgi:heat shock protein HslJ
MPKLVARPAMVLAVLMTALSFAAPPPLASDVLPPGVWTLVAVDGAPSPWPAATVQIGVADDGTTLLVDAGCTRIMATASRTRAGLALEIATRSGFSCDGDRAAADAVVLPALERPERVEVVAGRLIVEGAGARLAYAPEAPPANAGLAGAPPVASSDRLDPSRFAPIVAASAANGALWVRDPLQVALLFASMPSSGRTAVVREDVPAGDATVVRLWFDGLPDDRLRGRWFEVRLARTDDGAWQVVAGRQASACAGGDDELVAGRCP